MRTRTWIVPTIVTTLLVAAALFFSTDAGVPSTGASAKHGDSGTMPRDSTESPVFTIVEGASGSANPYEPAILRIPAGRDVTLRITDNLGGCGLVTVFPELGPNRSTIRVRVPVGQTREIVVHATKPGRYKYHCAEKMYQGLILAE